VSAPSTERPATPERDEDVAMAKPWFDHREVAAAAAVVESGWV